LTRGTDTADAVARNSDEVATATQRRRARGPESAVPPRDGYIGAGGTPQTRFGGWWEHHPRTLRTVAGAALAWGGAWLAYRACFSWRGANPFAFAALVLVEGFNLLSLGLLTFAGWDRRQDTPRVAAPGWAVDIFVCTYDEPIEVVEATLAGCAALRYPHTTYLLDDGRREEMHTLASRWDARWITRPDNRHAKAGNINHALPRTDGDLIFFLDADHVPLPDALDLTVGYFSDPRVALVQSPHDFYNQDSVQHYEAGRHEQSLFFEVVCPGKDRHNASFWCGSATVVRRVALEEVGGVATETIAEDFHTTIKMHRRGWRTRYHNQVLVQGLAPVDLDGYLLQRDRWARGNLAVFRLPESPLRRNGLDIRQRIAYFASLFAYGAGFTYLLMLAVLIAALGGGVLPARAGEAELLGLWVPATLLAVSATIALCRGHMRLAESSRYTIVSAEIFARALRCAFFPSKTKFKVTPKEGVDTGGWPAVRRLRLVLVLSGLLGAALVWRVLALVHVVHARPLPGLATPLAIALAIWELSRIAATIRHVSRRRQRRRHFRFSCELPAVVATEQGAIQTATIADLSLAGLSLEADDRIEPGTPVRLATTVATVAGPYRSISIEAVVRSCRPVGDRAWRLGIEITHMDDDSERELVTFCHVVHPWHQLRPHEHVAEPPPMRPVPVSRVRAPAAPSPPARPTTSRDDLLEALRREVDDVERMAHASSRRPRPERPRGSRSQPREHQEGSA
jgi:cellulose synthase (UDP-forming)